MQQNIRSSIDTEKIKKAIQSEVPLQIMTYTLPHEMEMYISEVLSFFLKELNQENMIEYLTYCLSELITNAKKANTKRIYFKEQNLDIFDETDYKSGMKTFKQDTLTNINKYLQMQKDAGLFIKVQLLARNGKIRIEIHNNAAMTVFEYKRIHDKLARAQQYTSIEEAFSQILDDSEGAGLGLIIMMLMLEKIGLTEDNFQVFLKNGETVTRIILPIRNDTQLEITSISKAIAQQIEELPHFPENITIINRMLNDPDSKMSEIAMQISNDVTLTADLLKLVNSAAFSLREPCPNIAKAVQIVGLHGIKNLLYSLGTIQNLGQNAEQSKDLWHHCYKVAFYAYNLALNFCQNEKAIVEDAYVCGLLHDIGKVLFQNAYPEMIAQYEKICREKNIQKQIIEKLFAGANHAEIGALIAEKWNFPDVICASIRFHHAPEEAPDCFKRIVGVVYLANAITRYETKEIEFYQIDADILNQFGIKREEVIARISEKLNKAFSQKAAI